MNFQVDINDEKTRNAIQNLKDKNSAYVQVRSLDLNRTKMMLVVLSDDQNFVEFYDQENAEMVFAWNFKLLLGACDALKKKLAN